MGKRDTSITKALDFWIDFYSKGHTMKPSKFAKFARPKMKGNVVDLGCGNGRDTYFLDKKLPTLGIDNATQPELEGFILGDVASFPVADNYYARFLFHAIPVSKENEILTKIKGKLFAETRAIGDDSFVPDHYRRLIDPDKFLKKLLNYGYSIEYFEISREFAKYKGQKPLVFRVIANKKKGLL